MQAVVAFWLNMGVDEVDTIQPSSALTSTVEALRTTLNQFKDRMFLAIRFTWQFHLHAVQYMVTVILLEHQCSGQMIFKKWLGSQQVFLEYLLLRQMLKPS